MKRWSPRRGGAAADDSALAARVMTARPSARRDTTVLSAKSNLGEARAALRLVIYQTWKRPGRCWLAAAASTPPLKGILDVLAVGFAVVLNIRGGKASGMLNENASMSVCCDNARTTPRNVIRGVECVWLRD